MMPAVSTPSPVGAPWNSGPISQTSPKARVSSGCRGEFEVVTGSPPPGGGTGLPDRVVCESKIGERTECRIPVGGRVRLVRQLSTTSCIQNNTWGSGYGILWVTKGCRGEFEVAR